jgi:hypothetical protein
VGVCEAVGSGVAEGCAVFVAVGVELGVGVAVGARVGLGVALGVEVALSAQAEFDGTMEAIKQRKNPATGIRPKAGWRIRLIRVMIAPMEDPSA